MAMFAELVESSRNLPNAVSDIGHIKLSMAEIQRRVASVRQKYPDDNATKAHYLLAGSGINGEDVANELQSIVFTPEKASGARSAGIAPAGSMTMTIPGRVQQLSSLGDPNQRGSLYNIDPNVNSYLRSKKEESILATIEDTAAAKAREFDIFLAQNVTLDWKSRKNEICKFFGVTTSQQTDSTSTSSSSSSSHNPLKRMWGRATPGQVILYAEFVDAHTEESSGVYQARAQRLAKVVANINDRRIQQVPVPIAHQFMEATRDSASKTDIKTRQMVDSWKILASITGERAGAPISERKFASEYIFQLPNATAGIAAADSSNLRKRIVEGSREYLQNQFYQLIEEQVARHPHEAQMGGIPSVYSKIRGYLNLKFWSNGSWTKPNLEIVNNVPIWALLYYMIRSGHYEEALQYTRDNEASFLTIERSFPSYIEAYIASPTRDLPRDMLERLHTEFHQHIQYVGATSDPYKYALYKLIGRCDLARKAFPEIIVTTEDWLWLHLMLAREVTTTVALPPQTQRTKSSSSLGGSTAQSATARSPRSPFNKTKGSEQHSIAINLLHEQYSLADLQRSVVQFGPKHFNGPNANQGVYFQVLLLCGLFERAVHYAYSFSVVDSVHFAVALTYYGLLRPVPDIQYNGGCELLTADRNDKTQLNFPALIGQYTSSFKYSDFNEAVDYLLLIGLNRDLPSSGSKQIELCRDALSELVLDTRAFAELLGTVMVNGNRKPGIIEKRMPLLFVNNESEYLNVITAKAAVSASDNGRTKDAILLYHLSEQYNSVIKLVNRMLGEVLSVTLPGQRPTRKDFLSQYEGAPMENGNTSMSFNVNPSAVSLADVDDPTYIARSMMALYTTNPAILSNVSQKNRQTCEILLKLLDAWDYFARKQWDQTIKAVEETNIITLTPETSISSIRERAQEFSTLDQSIARNVPTMLLMVVKSLVQWSQGMNESSYVNSGRSAMLARLRDMARSTLLYAGMIEYRMPREVYNQLTQLEVAI